MYTYIHTYLHTPLPRSPNLLAICSSTTLRFSVSVCFLLEWKLSGFPMISSLHQYLPPFLLSSQRNIRRRNLSCLSISDTCMCSCVDLLVCWFIDRLFVNMYVRKHWRHACIHVCMCKCMCGCIYIYI